VEFGRLSGGGLKMMRTIEILLVIIIITAAFIISSFFAVLPIPRRVSPLNLRRIALTTLQMLDVDHDLSEIVFKPENDSAWGELQIALSASLPPNIVYNLTVYEVQSGSSAQLYRFIKSISNAESLGIGSDAGSYLVASSNVTFNVIPEKIGESGVGGTLYILNCNDARGWWITGYTAQSLAQDLYNLLSSYFQTTIMVQNTTDLGKILNGTSLQGETVQNAVVINTFGEAVPIPSEYCKEPYSNNSYAYYCYFLGQQVRRYNWTWASIVGYPFYYVSNTISLKDQQNGWGIYGMNRTGPAGMNAFLQGLDNKNFNSDSTDIKNEVGVVSLSAQVLENCNYYGIYPYPNQTSTRALKNSTLASYNLYPTLQIFNSVNVGGTVYNPGALYNHRSGTRIEGSLLALGLTRTPDVRLTAIGLLSYYKPRLYRSEYTATNATRLVVLQLGQVGGV
jgi:hypothetical protein